MTAASEAIDIMPNTEEKVFVDVELINDFDENRVIDGLLKLEQVRKAVVNAIVDTEKMLVSIPIFEILKLGLTVVREDVFCP